MDIGLQVGGLAYFTRNLLTESEEFKVHSYVHPVTKKLIYLTQYVCYELIFGGLQFPINKIF